MYKSKLYKILKVFSTYELEMLNNYINDPNFNKHDKVKELFTYIQLNFDSLVALEKEKVFKKLFPKEKFNDLKLRHLMSYTLKLVEEFGYIQIEKQNSFEPIYKQLSFYSEKDFTKGIEETQYSFNTTLEKSKINTPQESYTKYNIYTLFYNHSIKLNRTEIGLLQELNKSLDEFFILSKLKVACSIVNQQAIFNQTINDGFFKDILEFTQSNYLQNPMIALYYHIYKLILENKIEQYIPTHDSFNTCLAIKNKLEIKDALLLLINFCIRQINQGNKEFEKRVFDHYKIGIEFEILLDKNKLSPFTYSNAVNIAIKQNEIEWVEVFIEKYKNNLDTENPEDYYALNKSKYLVAIKKYSEALDFINKTDIQDLLTQLQLRIIQLKIFIELDEYNLAESFIANFKQMLKRKNILAYHKTNFSKIAKYMTKLIHLAPYATKAKEKLILDISNEKVLSEKAWFIEKLSQ
jgi:hypothetical protein